MNNVILIGRLTRDPELRYAQSGMAVTRFGLAVDRPFAKKEDPNAVTADFFNVTIFGKRAETCAQYLAKGRLTAVRGRIQNDNYTDKDGIKRYSVSIIAFWSYYLCKMIFSESKFYFYFSVFICYTFENNFSCFCIFDFNFATGKSF